MVFEAATFVDDRLLADLSFGAVYTGVMLAGLGGRGHLRRWWVLASLALGIGCAFTGRLAAAAVAARCRRGRDGPMDELIMVSAGMIVTLGSRDGWAWCDRAAASAPAPRTSRHLACPGSATWWSSAPPARPRERAAAAGGPVAALVGHYGWRGIAARRRTAPGAR